MDREVKITKKEKVKKEKPKKLVKKKKNEKIMTDLDGNVVKKAETRGKKKFNLKKHVLDHKKAYLILAIVVVSIIVIFACYILIRNIILDKKYGIYEEKMDAYALSSLYENGSPKSSEKVKKAEMVKIVMAVMYDTININEMGFFSQDKFDSDEWVTAATDFGIIEKNSITEKNFDKNVTYEEMLKACLNARSKKLNIPVSSTKEASFKNLQAYTEEQRRYINDAVEKEIIDDGTGKIDLEKDLFKGEFNKIIVNIVEKYNTIVPEGETIVTKKESLPSNSNIYPYILYSVDKEAYEYKGFNEGGEDYATPVETYKYRKGYYDQMQYRSEDYYTTIVNIDYNTITLDSFKEQASKYLRYAYPENYYKDYVDYVKQNKIIIAGTAKVQLPIFYLDGMKFRARVKLTFEIKNAETNKNILFGDLTRGQDVTYKDKKYELYIDVPLASTVLSQALRLDMEPVIDLIVSDKQASKSNEI